MQSQSTLLNVKREGKKLVFWLMAYKKLKIHLEN